MVAAATDILSLARMRAEFRYPAPQPGYDPEPYTRDDPYLLQIIEGAVARVSNDTGVPLVDRAVEVEFEPSGPNAGVHIAQRWIKSLDAIRYAPETAGVYPDIFSLWRGEPAEGGGAVLIPWPQGWPASAGGRMLLQATLGLRAPEAHQIPSPDGWAGDDYVAACVAAARAAYDGLRIERADSMYEALVSVLRRAA